MYNMQVRLVLLIHERVQLNRNVIQRSINDHLHRDDVLDAEHEADQPAQADLVTGSHTYLVSRERIDVQKLANGVAVAYVARVDLVPIETSWSCVDGWMCKLKGDWCFGKQESPLSRGS
jgi:hypothetical protein